jgi:hypothetical protein
MQVGYERAVEVFGNLNKFLRAPSLHPYYVSADSKREAALRPAFFIYEESGDLFYHGFHVAPVEETGFSDVQSPYGYGGPVTSGEDEDFLKRAWAAYASWCEENDVLAEFIRFHPMLENWKYYGGEVVDDRLTVHVDLTVEDLLSTYEGRARTAVRKAINRGLTVEWVDTERFMGIFPSIYNESMEAINADKFYFFPAAYFSELFEWDSAHLAVCGLDGQVVAAAVFLIEGDMMEYHLSASTPEGKNLGATNLLLHEAFLYAQSLGLRVAHLGGGNSPDLEDPLYFFKSGFSPLRASFRIGKRIIRSEDYDKMKIKWQEKHGAVSDRVLFYR